VNIKGKKRALGIVSKIKSSTKLAASMMVMKGKEYSDFEMSVDILFKSSGVGGIAFRMTDEFNYYAFLIDKNLGHKAIVKVVHSKITILKLINDGGILINNWHTVTITVKANSISVYIYDKENAAKSATEKKIEVQDFTFSRGSIGFFVNGLNGFFIDEFTAKPLECVSPWQPIPYVEIRNNQSNIFIEDFSGSITEKYTTIDIEEIDNREGPAKWEIVNDEIELSYIKQSTGVYDASSSKRPSIALVNYLNFQNGIYKLVYNPCEEEGMVSIILKYNRESEQNKTPKEQFFSFDAVNEKNESYYTLRKWNNGIVTVLSRYVVDENTVKQTKIDLKKAYIAKASNFVEIEFINQKITARVSHDGENYVDIVNLKDESIQSGTIGFGTYKTCAEFKKIHVDPPTIKFSPKDIEHIMSQTMEEIPLPSVVDIEKIGMTSSCTRYKNYSQLPALSTVLAYSSILGSTLGTDFCGGNGGSGSSASGSLGASGSGSSASGSLGASGSGSSASGSSGGSGSSASGSFGASGSGSSASGSFGASGSGSSASGSFGASGSNSMINNEMFIQKYDANFDNKWKICISSRTQTDREKYCNNNYDSELMKKRCEVNKIL